MSKYTPGPWQRHGSHIYSPDREILAQVRNPGRREGDYPLVANARLIAAAPDLLEAAERVLTAIATPIYREHPLHALRAAVDKARGND